jgi:hypothetical protein
MSRRLEGRIAYVLLLVLNVALLLWNATSDESHEILFFFPYIGTLVFIVGLQDVQALLKYGAVLLLHGVWFAVSLMLSMSFYDSPWQALIYFQMTFAAATLALWAIDVLRWQAMVVIFPLSLLCCWGLTLMDGGPELLIFVYLVLFLGYGIVGVELDIKPTDAVARSIGWGRFAWVLNILGMMLIVLAGIYFSPPIAVWFGADRQGDLFEVWNVLILVHGFAQALQMVRAAVKGRKVEAFWLLVLGVGDILLLYWSMVLPAMSL